MSAVGECRLFLGMFWVGWIMNFVDLFGELLLHWMGLGALHRVA
jgi:hypothetical protein